MMLAGKSSEACAVLLREAVSERGLAPAAAAKCMWAIELSSARGLEL